MRLNRAMQSVWVNEKTCPMCSFPLTVSGGVSTAKTSPREAVRSNLYYARGFPPARPLVLDAVKRRLARHEAGAGAGFGTHGARVAYERARLRTDYSWVQCGRRNIRPRRSCSESPISSSELTRYTAAPSGGGSLAASALSRRHRTLRIVISSI